MISKLMMLLCVFGFAIAIAVADSKESVKITETKENAKEAEQGHGEEGEEEGSSNVGPDKGILEANERQGFKLSPEALKNFEVKSVKLTGDGPWTIPSTALIHSGNETNILRIRQGFFKSVDFEIVRRSGTSLVVDGDDLREGDEIALTGLGFLKTAELAAFGGVAHGHSH